MKILSPACSFSLPIAMTSSLAGLICFSPEATNPSFDDERISFTENPELWSTFSVNGQSNSKWPMKKP